MCLAIPGKIKEIYEKNQMKMGRVDFDGTIQEICLNYVPTSKTGNYIIAHNGLAINKLSEKEAKETLKIVKSCYH